VLSWRFDFGKRVSWTVHNQNCFEKESRKDLLFGRLFDGQKPPEQKWHPALLSAV